MRKYMLNLLPAFYSCSSASAKTAHTNNGIFWSYNTPVALNKDGEIYASIEKFSRTTSGQVNAIRRFMLERGIFIQFVKHDELLKLVASIG